MLNRTEATAAPQPPDPTQSELTLAVFGLAPRTLPAAVVDALRAQHVLDPITRATLNPRGNTCFVTFATRQGLSAAHAVARAHRLVVGGKACRAECSDAATEAQLGDAAGQQSRVHEAYEDPTAGFVGLLVARGVTAEPLFPLLTPGPASDQVAFANAWKSLLFEECRAQLWDALQRLREGGDGVPWYQVCCVAPQQLQVAEQQRQLDALLVHDAFVLAPAEEAAPSAAIGTTAVFGIVSSVRGRMIEWVSRPPHTLPVDEQRPLRLYWLGSLLTAKRCYDALSWYHTASLAQDSNPVLEALFRSSRAPEAARGVALPRAPATLNAAQGRVVTALSVLERGALLCQGPPGSGKTTLTVAAIHVVARPGARVLVCAPSNKAVLEVLERFRGAYPELPVVFCGNRRRPLPDAAQHVYADTFFTDRVQRLRNAATAGHAPLVEAVCAELQRWKLVDAFAGGARVVELLLRQCGRLKRGECWSCGRVLPCANCAALGDWHTASKAIGDLERLLLGAGDAAQQLLLQHSRVVFATLATAGRRVLQRALSRVDALLVDEAAQASEPELLVAMRFAPTLALLIGDPQQLPATVFSDAAAALGYGVSTMERLMVRHNYESTLLDEQYRMMPAIRRWPSEVFYGGRIRDAPSVTQRAVPWGGAYLNMPATATDPFGGRAGLAAGNLCLVDMGATDSGETAVGTSWMNERELDAVQHVLLRLKRAAPASFDVARSVGVITMYRAQQAELAARLERVPQLRGVRVSTVDGFQGGEMDVVIVTMVRSRATPFLADPKRLNVALTRARFYCVLVAHAASLSAGDPLLKSLFDSFAPEQRLDAAQVATAPTPPASHSAGSQGRSRGSPSKREWTCHGTNHISLISSHLFSCLPPGCGFYNFSHRAACLKCTRSKTPEASSDSGDDVSTLGSTLSRLRVSALVDAAALQLQSEAQSWTCAACSKRNVKLLCTGCRSARPNSWQALLVSDNPTDNEAVVALLGGVSRDTVFRNFATCVLFEHCPAARTYDNLDAQQLQTEARLWARYRALARWLAADTPAVVAAATALELPVGLVHRLRQYLRAYGSQ